jgi:hypothetical protein
MICIEAANDKSSSVKHSTFDDSFELYGIGLPEYVRGS